MRILPELRIQLLFKVTQLPQIAGVYLEPVKRL